MKILIIEDEALLAESLKTLLELRGFEVEVVSDGESGAECGTPDDTIGTVCFTLVPADNENGFTVAAKSSDFGG